MEEFDKILEGRGESRDDCRVGSNVGMMLFWVFMLWLFVRIDVVYYGEEEDK